MTQRFHAENWLSPDGIPAGGVVKLITPHPAEPDAGELGDLALNNPALYIRWQTGPLVDADGVRHEPNGCFVETVIEAVKQRLEHYQETKFNCIENAEMLGHLEAFLAAAHDRTRRRTERGVEGTSQV